jgi:uncharacterized protein with PhoU and TrkA domain
MEEQFEKIVKDFVELKDTSEIMLDMAYSAILLNSRELAEEVLKLEDRIDVTHNDFQLHVISCGGLVEKPEERLGLIELGEIPERIADAAEEIAEVVLRGLEPHPVMRMVIRGAEETVVRATVPPDSPLIGKTLKEARIPEQTGMWILVVRRGDKWMRPTSATTLQAGDFLLASGYSEGREDFWRLVGEERRRRRR